MMETLGAETGESSAATPEGVEALPHNERVGVLRSGSYLLGVTGSASAGLLEIQSPTSLPRSPEHVLGVAHLRGKIVPILDLGRALALDAPGGDPLTIGLVVEVAGRTAVLAAAEIVAFESFDLHRLTAVESHLPSTLRRFASGQLRYLDREVMVLNIESLLEALRDRHLAGSAALETT